MPFESTKVSLPIQFKCIDSFGLQRFMLQVSLAAEEDVRITSLCPTCLPVASMKKEDSMLFDFRLMLNSDLLYLC